jgi:cell division protein FtsI (penicillin-binding protein 3)
VTPVGRGRSSVQPPARRLVALLTVMILGLSAILARLLLIQVKDASAYQTLALDQRVKTIPLPATRGTIFDRSGHELAMSLPATTVYADPALVKHPIREARLLAADLDADPATILAALQRPKRFVYVARGVEGMVARKLRRRHLPGIGFFQESRRYYPAGPLAPQVVGFVGFDGQGLAGLELQYQRLLAGHPGSQVVEQDPSGTLIPQGTNRDTPPVPGAGMVLTIDRDIQYRAQEALADAVRTNHAKGGTVIVMDPRTGEILAMATYPWFDPNHLDQADPAYLRNPAATDAFEPGSVNKVITAAAAIQERVLRLNQRFSIPDHLKMYDKVFHDAHPHPEESMTLGDIIAYSSNIGAIHVAGLLGKTLFSSYLHRFGFGHSTGLGFPGESRGILAPADRWSGTDMGAIPIGQGVAVTPLQMVSVYATIANGGVRLTPRLVKGTVDSEGALNPVPVAPGRRVVSEQTAHIVARLLAYAVDVGTGTEAQMPGWWVAGKTGTARKPLPDGTGYYDGKYVAAFIGFVPASRPSLVIGAVLDEPATVFGGVASAPLFRDVARFAIAKLRVPPARKPGLPPHAIATGGNG